MVAVASTKSKAASSIDLHTRHRGATRRSEHNFDVSRTRPVNRSVQSNGGLLVSNLFLPHLVGKTKVLERDPDEARAYFDYVGSPKIFKKLADYCEFGEGQRSYSFKKRIVDFLYDRRKAKDLKNAMFFLYNLETLSNVRNPDGSKVKGVERVFENAEEAMVKGDRVHGFYFEAISALSLMERGFSIKEVSVRKIERNGIVEELIDTHGSPREIDFIAQKDFGEGVAQIFCDAKSSVVSMILSNEHSKQIDAMIEIANKYGALPAIILKTREAKISSDGSINYFQPFALKPKDKRQIIKFLTDYPKLLIWDETGSNVVSSEEVQAQKEERSELNAHRAFRTDDRSYKLEKSSFSPLPESVQLVA